MQWILNLNEHKTQVVVFGPPDPHSYSKGESFMFDKKIKAVVRASFFKLRFWGSALVLGCFDSHHIPPALASLLCLRRDFKINMSLPSWSFNYTLSQNITEVVWPDASAYISDRAFAVADSELWTCLLLHIRTWPLSFKTYFLFLGFFSES